VKLVRVAALALALVSCAGAGISRSELPSEPLAFVFRSETEAQERAEALAKAEGRAEQPGEGKARLDALGDWLGLNQSAKAQRVARLGQLAFFDLRADDIEVADFALPGARPLDWSPDRERLLLASLRSGSPQLYEWSRQGAHLRAVTSGPFAHPTGCYGPEGRLAYVGINVGDERVQSRIFVTGPGGARPRLLTPGPADGSPSWSPDGSVIVYGTNAYGDRARIMAIDPSGGGPRVIARGRRPVFTPDGGWVVYSARTRKGWRLRRMRPDGSGKMAFGDGPTDEHAPSVSPDGRYVAYVETVGDRERLRVRALDGSGDRPLLSHGDGVSPAWN
jgi:dipeptidyl aminopeptidase/acylaminoacyl peptidase